MASRLSTKHARLIRLGILSGRALRRYVVKGKEKHLLKSVALAGEAGNVVSSKRDVNLFMRAFDSQDSHERT